MKILIVKQVTGNHGWSSFEAYINGFKDAGFQVNVCCPRAEWGSEKLETHDGLEEKLRSLNGSDIVLFCGFDWHSQVLHSNVTYSNWIRATNAKKIGVFQEHISADWLQNDTDLKSKFDGAAKSALELITHVVCNHEMDVNYLRENINNNKRIIFLPFFADLSVFKRIQCEPQNKAFFRGKLDKLMDSDPYFKRNAIIQALRYNSSFEFKSFDFSSYSSSDEMVKKYNQDLNDYTIQLNLPSLSNSLTCRPFEIGAVGACLISEKPDGLYSQGIFTDEEANLVEDYTAQNLVKVVELLKSDTFLREKKQSNLYDLVKNKHSHIKRVKSLISWVENEMLDMDIYSELINDKLKGRTLVDLVFFQYAESGIARVWHSILHDIAEKKLSKYFILIKRKGTKFKFSELIEKSYHILEIEPHSYERRFDDYKRLNEIYRAYKAQSFITTYFTYTNFRNFVLLHDFIPERIDKDCYFDQMWKEKKEAIENATAFFTISDSTCDDLFHFYPEVIDAPVYASYNKAKSYLPEPVKGEWFKNKYKLAKHVILVVGERIGYKGYKNIPNALCALSNYIAHNNENIMDYSILFVGGGDYGNEFTVEPEIEQNIYGFHIVRTTLNDQDLATAYSVADLLLYPSLIEGFGLPPVEAAHYNTPTLLVDNKINREIWGSDFTMAASGAVKDLENCIELIFENSSYFLSQVKEFKKTRLRALELRGETQALSVCENILLHTEQFLESNVLAYKDQVFSWRERLKDSSYFKISGHEDSANQFKVTCILSLFKAEQFVEHCLEDLVNQTLFINGEMEIIIIDSCSPQNEYEFVKKFIKKYKNIFYYKTPVRETLYMAWSRACRLARGKYITNTNADDRHRSDFMECLSNFLDSRDEIQLVYPQQYITFNKNEDFSDHHPMRIWGWPDYSLKQLKVGNHVGSQPMWRRAVHNKVGYFQTNYTCAGDYEFWLRIASQVGPLALYPVPIGTYYFNPLGIEHGDPIQSKIEMDEICDLYGIIKNYEVSDDDSSEKSEGRNFDSLQYNGLELKNNINIILTVNDDEHIKQKLFNIEMQSVLNNHSHKLFLKVEYERVKHLIEKEVNRCQTRSFFHEELDLSYCCSIAINFTKDVDIDRNLFENLVTELYSSPEKVLEYTQDGVVIEVLKNG